MASIWRKGEDVLRRLLGADDEDESAETDEDAES